jgi:hypothetical protein
LCDIGWISEQKRDMAYSRFHLTAQTHSLEEISFEQKMEQILIGRVCLRYSQPARYTSIPFVLEEQAIQSRSTRLRKSSEEKRTS